MLLTYILYLSGDGPEVEKILSEAKTNYPATEFINAVTLRAANRLWALREPQQSRETIEAALRQGDDDAANILHTFRAAQLAFAGDPEAARQEMSGVDLGLLDPFGQVVRPVRADIGCRRYRPCSRSVRGRRGRLRVIEAAPRTPSMSWGSLSYIPTPCCWQDISMPPPPRRKPTTGSAPTCLG